MEMKITMVGFGIGIPKTDVNFNVGTLAYLEIRANNKDQKPKTFGLGESFSLGAGSSTFVFGNAKTKWFFIDPIKNKWIANPEKLVGKKMEIEISGLLIANGKVDVKITAIDEHGDTKELMNKVDIEAGGAQVAATKIRGVVKRMPGKK